MSSPDGRGARGRPFAPGNAGRPPGAKNKNTLLAAALLDGEMPELLRKAIELAKRGNIPMLKFLLARLLPRDRLISIDMPEIVSASDARRALQSILRAVSLGEITPAEAAALASLLAPFIHGSTAKLGSNDPAPSLFDHLQSQDKE